MPVNIFCLDEVQLNIVSLCISGLTKDKKSTQICLTLNNCKFKVV